MKNWPNPRNYCSFPVLEFIKSEAKDATDQEMEFVTSVADTFQYSGR